MLHTANASTSEKIRNELLASNSLQKLSLVEYKTAIHNNHSLRTKRLFEIIKDSPTVHGTSRWSSVRESRFKSPRLRPTE